MPAKPIETTQMTLAGETSQPLLVESTEFRSRVDADGTDAQTKIDRIDRDIQARQAEIASLQQRRNDLLLIVQAREAVLVIIPSSAGVVITEHNEGHEEVPTDGT